MKLSIAKRLESHHPSAEREEFGAMKGKDTIPGLFLSSNKSLVPIAWFAGHT
jgi:hypothetical protein